MKPLVTALTLLISGFAAWAFFVPKNLEDKVSDADLIAVVTVRSITRIMPADFNAGVSSKGLYMGALSIAAAEIEEVWKIPPRNTFFSTNDGARDQLPKTIMIPCGYTSDESASSLTQDKRYVLFLRSLDANLYHPVDPASTHRIKDNQVCEFGVNADPDPESPSKVMSVEAFKKLVMEHIPKIQRPK